MNEQNFLNIPYNLRISPLVLVMVLIVVGFTLVHCKIYFNIYLCNERSYRRSAGIKTTVFLGTCVKALAFKSPNNGPFEALYKRQSANEYLKSYFAKQYFTHGTVFSSFEVRR